MLPLDKVGNTFLGETTVNYTDVRQHIPIHYQINISWYEIKFHQKIKDNSSRQVLCVRIALKLKSTWSTSAFLCQRLLFLLSYFESFGLLVFRLLVSKCISYHQNQAWNDEAHYWEDHEKNVRDEVGVSDCGSRLLLALLGGQGKGQDEYCWYQKPDDGVEFRFGGVPAGEAPDDGEDNCNNDNKCAYSNS